jgi:hypothetical protein
MPRVRAGGQKWTQRTAAAARDYAAGVQTPRTPWAAATSASEHAWQAGVQDAVARGAFGKGVQKAGDAKWQQGVATKGVQRFAPGVQAAQARYDEGFAPYRAAIEAITLPARGRRGDPANLERVRLIDTALHDLRTQQRR